MKYVVLTILGIIAGLTKAEVKLPKYIIPCKAKDSLCLKNLLKELAPRLKLGIREFSLPTIDPVDLPDYNMSDYSSPIMPFAGFVKNVQYRGASNFEVSKFDIDLGEMTFNLVVFFPQLIMRCYEIAWIKAFDIEVDGEGFVTQYYNNVTISFSLQGTKYTNKENEHHVKWTEDRIRVSMAGGSFDVDPSYTDDNFQKFLNKASRYHGGVFYPKVELYIKITFGDFILKTLNTVHEIFPIDVLYVPDQIKPH